ncbi:MAG TPA: signal recognition particle receptor subunit alpha, partial [candidate division Zixibacteria bacterium]|nr:signal recognition particle receptor subunit alpha [candidate division Zixibacteria bacterium]
MTAPMALFNPLDKLKNSLARTKDKLLGRLSEVVRRRAIDDDLLEDIEEILVQADVGLPATERLIARVKEAARERRLTEGDQIIDLLKEEIVAILSRTGRPLFPPGEPRPAVWLIVGVNGVGKTTTIGKLATLFSREGKKVSIAACDTFRAAAIDQLSIWAERSRVALIRPQEGSDPAAVAFDAARAAHARGLDLLLVDTAGRLHTKSNPMEERKKIRRVIAQ